MLSFNLDIEKRYNFYVSVHVNASTRSHSRAPISIISNGHPPADSSMDAIGDRHFRNSSFLCAPPQHTFVPFLFVLLTCSKPACGGGISGDGSGQLFPRIPWSRLTSWAV